MTLLASHLEEVNAMALAGDLPFVTLSRQQPVQKTGLASDVFRFPSRPLSDL